MTTVGIYSDSWADPLVRSDTPFDNIAWPDIVGKRYEVTNYARGGSSIYYSYQQFLETYENFDKIIFVVTDYYRWFHLVKTPTIKSPWGDYYHSFAGPGMIEYWRKDPMYASKIDSRLKNIFVALEQYFVHLNDATFDKTICSLMLDDVYKKRPDTIFVQGGIFPEFHPLVNPEFALAKYAISWVKEWPECYKNVKDGYGFFPWEELKTICHFAKEVNEVIAEHMIEALGCGKWSPKIPDTIPAEHKDFGYYYNYNRRLWK